jgi:predicted class III extradiol MEMO1 family dioxygenase
MAVARTIRNETKAISLKSSDLLRGEYLVYKLKVWGAQGIFSIVDEKSRILIKSTDFPHSQQEYSRKWPTAPQEIPPEKDIIYTLVVSFNKATKYTYSIEYHKADGSSPVTLKSIDFESQNISDSDYNTLRVLLRE